MHSVFLLMEGKSVTMHGAYALLACEPVLTAISILTQVEADIRPFRGMLLGLFFVSTGASLDLQLLLHEFPIIIALLIGLLAVKVGIIGICAQFFGLSR